MKKSLVGGQAVMEGVMMRSPDKYAVAVRKPNGKISVKKEKIKSVTKKYKFLNWFFFRGNVALIENLSLGFKALIYSANESGNDEEKLEKKDIFFSIATAVFFAVVIFMVLPFFLTGFLTNSHSVAFNAIDGLIKVAFFLIYIVLISQLSDMKTLFRYHGAEHMAVHTYEHGKKLTVENCRKYSTVHSRCGTSFLVILLILSIFIFSLVITENWVIRLSSRILLLPVIAGFSYEILKIGSRFEHNSLMKAFMWPGLLFQKITTKEPNKKQLETAIAALKAVTP
ncbi:MAG: DUF1385 domain-containing protein [bacterium]|nr:DUF1385 domain-containing protein [bacterium]